MSVMPCPNCGNDKIDFLELQIHVRRVTQDDERVYLDYDFLTEDPDPKEIGEGGIKPHFKCNNCGHTWELPEDIEIDYR